LRSSFAQHRELGCGHTTAKKLCGGNKQQIANDSLMCLSASHQLHKPPQQNRKKSPVSG
jgi:hypothetical protein